ncbi:MULTISPECIES: hypothetical protein [Mesorhizobium]|nr:MULTISPECIES: hypothetical protein [Mesorhizobium]
MAGKDCEQFIDDSVCAASVESRVEERSFVAIRAGCGSAECGCF